MPQKFLSILFPSRGRFASLANCLGSLIGQLSNEEREQVEVIIRLDSDDSDTLIQLSQLPYDKISIRFLVGDRGNGYADIYKWVNEMARLSTGTYILGWGDDIEFKTPDWFSILKRKSLELNYACCFWFANKPIRVKMKSGEELMQEWPCTPALHRSLFEVMGCMSGVGGVDSFLAYVLDPLGLLKKIPEIRIDHTPWFDVPENSRDQTARDIFQDGRLLPTNWREVEACRQRIIDFATSRDRSTAVGPLKVGT